MNIGLVSIMMPAYNVAHYIGQAIDSVIAQTFTDWELIVVNDGSTDQTREIVEAYHDPRIRLINQPNGGEASARNTALETMQGEYTAFLDADDLFLPHHLKTCVEYLNEHRELEGVYTDGNYCDENGSILQKLSSQRRGPFTGWIFEQLVRASDVFGPPICVVLRRNKLMELDLHFDTRIVIGPDWDFLTRFAEFATFGYLGQQTCLYRVHKTNVTVRTKRLKRIESLSICREKAIKAKSFSHCSLETRAFAFYDLLINLLPGFPERQTAVTYWPEFVVLPLPSQARLLRLMSSQEISMNGDRKYAKMWLERARQIHPGDIRSALLISLFSISPLLCSWVLRTRRFSPSKEVGKSPFGELG